MISPLLKWFTKHGRDLPWRHTRDPYQIWVSEIMLQQTQVDRVLEFYQKFLKKFPTVQKLAKATWPQLLSVWRGLGYYRRARNMLATAKAVVGVHRGQFPTMVDELEQLPGIGPYTARAIAVFAYEQDELVLDTNTRRVFSRFYGGQRRCADCRQHGVSRAHDSQADRRARHLSEIVPHGKAWAFHQALMDLGATVCTAKEPKCGECPLKRGCGYYAVIASKAKQSPRKRGDCRTTLRMARDDSVLQIAAGIIHRDGQILIARRPRDAHLGGLWEFPGGKRESGEDWRTCLKREIKEELGIEVAVRPHDWMADYRYPDRTVHIRFHRCSILRGKARPREGQEIRWVSPSELKNYSFPPANVSLLKTLTKTRFVDPQRVKE